MRVRARMGLSTSLLMSSLLLATGLRTSVSSAGSDALTLSRPTTQPRDVQDPISGSPLTLAMRSDPAPLLMMQADETVYAPPAPPSENDFVNSGASISI